MHQSHRNLKNLLSELKSINVKVGVKDGNLHVSAPKGAINDALRSELVARKDELISFILHREGKIEPIQETIGKTSRDNPEMLPLSFSQEGVWYLEKLNPGTARYHVPFGIEFVGPVRSEILQESIRWLVLRHESLRTRFVERNGLPHPQILDDIEIPFEKIDLKFVSRQDKEFLWGKRLRDFLHGPFDLSSAPLFRAALIELDDNLSHLIFNFHHLIVDGWSLGILIRELGEAYQSFLSGLMPTAEPLDIQFVDYASWQRAQFQDPDQYKDKIEYWEHHLAGAPELINLPTDRPRLGDSSGSGGIINFRVNQEISNGIRQLAKRENATPFMVLLGAFYILLYRYSRQDDIVVGTPISNRSLEEFEPIVGFFANTLALRAFVDGSDSFVEFLRDVRKLTLEGFDHQDIPFEMVVDKLQPKRSSAHNPIYQVMFALQNNQVEWPEIRQLKTRFLNHFAMENARLDLFFEMWEEGDFLIGQVEYDSHLFDILSVRRMVSHFVTLLNGITRMSTGPIADLPLMLPDERNQIVYEWNRNDFPYPNEALLNELFELQVRRSSGSVALQDPASSRSYTWKELNELSNQLGHYLLDNGLTHQSLVGVSMERSADLIVSLLAIVKIGAAWLPLDPDYPQSRLQYIVEDADPDAILYLGESFAWIGSVGPKLVDLDLALKSMSSLPTSNLQPKINSGDPLYVLYTSGSTGKPKGVVANHQSVINRFSWMWNKFPFSSTEVCVHKTSLSFVDSVWEIFGPLLKGIPLVIAPNEVAHNPSKLVPFLSEYDVTRIVLVPSMLRSILDQTSDVSAKLPKLHTWTTSGEALSIELYRTFTQELPQAKLLNLYGSTEVGADVTCLDTSQYPTPTQMYIGRPIDNIGVYILDDFLEPVPVGVPGELYISGEGLAMGYYKNDALTRERFIDNPFEPETVMFKTGDLGRFNSDGQIEYLGRADFQLKIRGVRIEPAEIENVLKEHPDIDEAIVGSWKIEGSDELVAWFNLSPSVTNSPEITDLRAFLAKKLPSYMLPSRFVNLPAVPRLPNGKINRNELPVPTLDMYRQSLPYTPPSDETERKLAEIWRQVLNQDRIGLYDDFFELGGQSIKAVQIFSLIRDEFGMNLALSELFESPTIAKLADLIRVRHHGFSVSRPRAPQNSTVEPSEGDTQPSYLVEINKGSSNFTPYFCVHGAGGNVLFLQAWKRHLEDHPFYAFQARGIDGVTAPHESIVEMAADYIKEMLKEFPDGPWVLGGYSGGGVVALEMAQQLHAMGHEMPPVIMLDTFHPNIEPKNYTMRDRVHLLTTNPVDYVRNVAQKRVVDNFKREYTRDELNAMMASGNPIPIELRNDYMTDHFGNLLDEYTPPEAFDGQVLLLCAEEIWYMFSHAGPQRGWENVLTNLSVHEVPGDHFAIIEEPAVTELIAQLKAGISRFSNPASI